MNKDTADLKVGDKFVAYYRKTGRKALWGGICTVVADTLDKKGNKRDGVTKSKKGSIKAVNAIDCNGQKRIFLGGTQWGFLKRT